MIPTETGCWYTKKKHDKSQDSVGEESESAMAYAFIIYLILGIIFCLYGFSVRMVGSGTAFYLIWFAGGIICFLHAAAAKKSIWKKVPVIFRKVSFIVFGACLLLFIFVEGLILSGFRRNGNNDPDYIIVLGAQVYESGPSVVLKYRLDKAVEYLEDHPQTMCIVTGGQGYNEPYAEALGMQEYLIGSGIPAERLVIENSALNTVQNIRYSAALLDERSIDIRKIKIGIVTNDFHVYRGVAIAKKQGFEHVIGIASASNPYFLPNNMLREFCGVCKDKLLGNM